MALLRVQMFGTLSVQSDHGPVTGFEVRKVQELLCFLLLHRERSIPREALAGQLWGETSTAQSRANLRKLLWRLHSSLEAHCCPLLLASHDCLQIDPQAPIWSDVEHFARAYSAVEGRLGEDLAPGEALPLADAVTLYRGQLLEGWYQEWCLHERERFQTMQLAMLDKLMGFCERQSQYERGLVYGELALGYDRAHEQIHRRMMRLYLLAGDRTGALRQYERCAATLQEEFGVEPTEYTAELLQQVRRNCLAPLGTDLPAAVSLTGNAVALRGLLSQLHQLDATLHELQCRVQGQIETLELAIGM